MPWLSECLAGPFRPAAQLLPYVPSSLCEYCLYEYTHFLHPFCTQSACEQNLSMVNLSALTIKPGHSPLNLSPLTFNLAAHL